MSRVAELEREGRFEQAAQLARELGDPGQAARLFERACDYAAAAHCALQAGQVSDALRLACQSGSEELVDELCSLLGDETEARAAAAAEDCRSRWPGTAGRLHEAHARWTEAATCYEEARDLAGAGRCLLLVPDPRNAARVLEAQLERQPEDLSSRLLLAELLLDHDRARNALSLLQGAAPDSPNAEALQQLTTRAARALGLDDAPGAGDSPDTQVPPPKTTTEASTAELLFGRYEVECEIARTANARVLRARDVVHDCRVAVKLYAPAVAGAAGRDVLLRFEREARALASLHHQDIMPLVDYLPEGPAVVTPWMAGGSLAMILESQALSPARGIEIVLSMLSALEVAHRQGILHRDIKPSNVLLDEVGAARLADFGAAHLAEASNTVTSGLIGTLGYMAPEIRGGEPATIKSDLYGVGAVLFHVLTGAPPDLARSPMAELSPAQEVLMRRLVGPLDDRPRDVAEMREWLTREPFPEEVPERRPNPESAPPSSRGERLRHVGDSRWFDQLLDRPLQIHAAAGDVLDRARGFARAGHPGLATIYALGEALWVEAPAPRPRRPLAPGEREWLGQALAALHRTGAVHGAVTREQLGLRGGQIVLCFPKDVAGGTSCENDLEFLAALD